MHHQPAVLLHEMLRINEEVFSAMLIEIPKKKKIRSSCKKDMLTRWGEVEQELLAKIL